MSTMMSVEEREAFLADVHVGVLSVAGRNGRAPLSVPIWYGYEPGGVVTFITGESSRKTKLLRETGRCSLCAQLEAPPYRYVTVEGPVVAIDPIDPEVRRAIAYRYLGPEQGATWMASTASGMAGSVVVRVRPEHWLSADFGKG
ncbi:MAG TPA: pyridoxamine 5'-phosphate oxidase family protein [Candidatus Dormibacteraeota bacterium]|jgi:nitroimidazol reductase NimA-like FMN-containing flavoprotein (pyridoxamine 5'-phosphate oxidase superfamily)